MKNYQYIFVALGVLFLLLVWIGLSNPPQAASASDSILTLQSPSLPEKQPSASFLNEEAGITAYVHISQTIRLDYVKSAFRVIEAQTEDYLIGSVSAPDYDIEYDAHVYVHESGWLVAYYPPTDPVSKIFDWKNRLLSPTLLENILTEVADKDGLTLPEVKYYDFRYPNATHMLWVKKNNGIFQVNVPSSFEFYERSWVTGACASGQGYVTYKLDETTLVDEILVAECEAFRNTLTEDQFRPDLMHTFQVQISYASGFSSLILVYRDPDETP